MLTVGSLFAGIGGFDLGFERAGMRTVWQVEQSEFCRRVLERHFPDAKRFEDVRDVGAAELQPVDLICGGFPCQDLSYAGKGAGLDGERSGLWSEYARIIRELRPRYVVVENVSALLARGLGRVLGDLAEIGYDAEWDCIPASAIGAPHRRDRLWLVAYPGGHDGRSRRAGRLAPGGAGEPESVRALQDPDANRGPQQERGERNGGPLGPGQPAPQWSDADGLREAVADTELSRLEGHGRGTLRSRPTTRSSQGGLGDSDLPSPDAYTAEGASRTPACERGWWSVEPEVGRVAHGVPARVDRLAALGNALVPQIAEWIGRRIIEWEEGEVAA